mgnify:CR=1 FL=1
MNRIRSIIGVCLLACVAMACSSDEKDRMVRSFITPPEEYSFEPCVEAGEKYSLEDFDVEYYTPSLFQLRSCVPSVLIKKECAPGPSPTYGSRSQ